MSTRTLYKVSAELSKCDGEISTGQCSCVAGKGSACKHLCCVSCDLMYIAQHDLSTVPGAVACTETERQWYKPRDPKKVSKHFDSVVFCKDTCQRIGNAQKHHEKREAYSSLRSDNRNLRSLDLINLHSKLRVAFTALQMCLKQMTSCLSNGRKARTWKPWPNYLHGGWTKYNANFLSHPTLPRK
ncbi:unnamed protein product [Ixodes hexagonus]